MKQWLNDSRHIDECTYSMSALTGVGPTFTLSQTKSVISHAA